MHWKRDSVACNRRTSLVTFLIGTLNAALNGLQARPMQDIMFREIAGNNIPHALFVRNRDEMIDQSLTQFGNTAAFFGTGYALDKGIDAVAKRVYKAGLTASQTSWLHLGKSMGILGLIASFMIASPFLRNFITAKRLGTTDFTQIVGERKRTGDAASKAKAQAEGMHYLKIFGAVLAAGAAFTVASLGLAHVAIRRGANFGKLAGGALKYLGLENGKFNNLNDIPAFVFWAVPTYAGFITASRDGFEGKEIALRFGAFTSAFFILPKVVEKSLQWAFKGKPVLNIPPNNMAYLGKFISSIIFCSAIPALVNIYLTRKRVQAADLALVNKTGLQTGDTTTKLEPPPLPDSNALPLTQPVQPSVPFTPQAWSQPAYAAGYGDPYGMQPTTPYATAAYMQPLSYGTPWTTGYWPQSMPAYGWPQLPQPQQFQTAA